MLWNLWHGCKKISVGCANCYVYRSDPKYDRDPQKVVRNACFSLPVQRRRDGEYKVKPGTHMDTCFTSDFFLEEADEWRKEAWRMIGERRDLTFFFLTKRIDRFEVNLPADWGEGYEHVTIGCTCENQDRADYRLPIFMQLPIKHRAVACSPLLGPIDLSPYLSGVEEVAVGGESGRGARVCDYGWVLSVRDQCREAGVKFWFQQTGARLVKDGRQYFIPRKLQHAQARKAGINLL